MDLQLVSILISLAVGLIIPFATWGLKAAITDRLAALTRQVEQLDQALRAQDRATAVLMVSRIPERLMDLEMRLAKIEPTAGQTD